MVADIVILLIPLPMIQALNLPRGQKLALLSIFCLGFLTCAISLVRLKYLPQGADVTWDNVDTMVRPETRAVAAAAAAAAPLAGSRKTSKARGGRKNKRSTLTTTTTTTSRRATNQWPNNADGGDDQDILVVVRPEDEEAAWEENQDHHEDDYDKQPQQQATNTTNNIAARKRSTRHHTTYLDLSSTSSSSSSTSEIEEEDGDIELRDIGTHLRHPAAVYDSGGSGSRPRSPPSRIGHAVEINSNNHDPSKPQPGKDLFIRVEREIAIEGSSR
ncbi:Integral membrane protein [Apiospora saccharicola]|uniref:Integral membrane protein n=1 Tax=Apiospora saccharicola TaxID=335842 RepID=A0ABR1WFY1_9PEZI